MKAHDLTGLKFGRLTALCRAPSSNGMAKWLCECECGKRTEVYAGNLRREHTLSCGCLNAENIQRGLRLRHGLADSRPHRIWHQMRARCRNENYSEFHLYGGRGITVCREWESFDTFWADMADGYSDDKSIDRINNDKGYCRENCRWATNQEQGRNTRVTIFIDTEWGRMALRDAADRAGLRASTVMGRRYLGWPDSELLGPLRRKP